MSQMNEHKAGVGAHTISVITTCVIHAAIFLMFALSSGSQPETLTTIEENTIFCRYIDNGRLFQMETVAADWQQAEEIVCGSRFRDVKLSPLLLEGALLIITDGQNDVLHAQRESCSCSDEERIPVLQDISIVEAPRLGAETKKTALPRIVNTPEQTQENTVTTNKDAVKKKDEKKVKKDSLDDILNAATNFDDARPVSDVDPGGSLDGSRLSKSAFGKGDPYLQKVKAKLDNTMNAPASIPKAQLQKLSAKVWIKIGENGSVWAWDYTSKSGNAAFDRMIETTIKQFMTGGQYKFAAPPEQWKLQTIPFTVNGSEIK